MLTKPASGGTPIMPSAPTVNAAMVSGMRRAHAAHLADVVDAERLGELPAQKNSVIFMTPWCTRWTMPPMLADRAEDGRAERDVGHLAHGGVGEPLLEPVLRSARKEP